MSLQNASLQVSRQAKGVLNEKVKNIGMGSRPTFTKVIEKK